MDRFVGALRGLLAMTMQGEIEISAASMADFAEECVLPAARRVA